MTEVKEITKPKRKRKAVKKDVDVTQESVVVDNEPEIIVDVVEDKPVVTPEIKEEVLQSTSTKCSCKCEEFTLVRNRLGKRRICNSCGLIK